MNYSNKTVVITGAAKGIGAACAKLFYDNGANVVLLDLINNEGDISGERWFYQHCDVSNEEQVKHAMDETIKKFQVDFRLTYINGF